jgi:leucyl/phenylalanyl-tRNA---protein transferase
MRALVRLDPKTLIDAYCRGVFPMAERGGEIRWYTADPRGIIPLDQFHVPKSLAQFMRSAGFPFEVRINCDFEGTMRACMESRAGETWISEEIIRAYVRLHRLGLAHSVEVWKDGQPAGGLYGVSLGGAFFGESMYHRERDASKVALAHLVQRLRERGYQLLDTQATTEHLRRFGCIDVPASEYLVMLEDAIQRECTFA